MITSYQVMVMTPLDSSEKENFAASFSEALIPPFPKRYAPV
jgi:hypothetical protein